MTPDHTAFQVRSSGYGRAGIGLSSWEGLRTGRHEKAPDRCPCSRLAILHGAPRTPVGGVSTSDNYGPCQYRHTRRETTRNGAHTSNHYAQHTIVA